MNNEPFEWFFQPSKQLVKKEKASHEVAQYNIRG